VRKDAQAVLLLLVGGTLIKISLTGTYVRYVKPSLLPLLLIAGAALVVVAGATLWQVIRRPLHLFITGGGAHAANGLGGAHAAGGAATDEDDVAGEDGAHDGHGHGESRVGWLLLVPALALLLFAPPALGSFQASRNGTALGSQAGSDFAPLPDGDPVRLSVLDYASRAVFDDGRSLAGRRVLLSGFVIAGPDGQPYLARLVVGCCAADARPIKVGLAGDVPADLVPDQWIEVVGNYTDRTDRDPVNQDLIPYLQVATARDIAPPEQQYEL
jgi:uncharacterized repeat protein (TIGR03943 family)